MNEQTETKQFASYEEYLSTYYPRLPRTDSSISASPTIMGVNLARESLRRNLATLRGTPGDEKDEQPNQ